MPATIKQVRWTLEEASAEFDISSMTLSKRIKARGIVPGPDGRFCTMDICRSKYSDKDAEQTGLYLEQKEFKRLQKLALAKKLCVLETVQRVWAEYLNHIRQKISNWQIPDEQKQDLIRELQEIPTDDYFPTDAPSPEVGDESDL